MTLYGGNEFAWENQESQHTRDLLFYLRWSFPRGHGLSVIRRKSESKQYLDYPSDSVWLRTPYLRQGNVGAMLDTSSVSTIVTAVSVVTGVVFTLFEICHLARVRRTDVITKICENFRSRTIVEAIFKIVAAKSEPCDNYVKEYGGTEALDVATLRGGVGGFLERDLTDIDLVDSLFGPYVNSLWAPIRPVIDGIRITKSRSRSDINHFLARIPGWIT